MTLSRLKRQGGISLKMPQRKRASSRLERRISWFFSSCGRKLGVPLELRREPQGPALVALGKSSLHASCEGFLGIPLQLVLCARSSSGLGLEPQVSPPGLTWISGFLWSFNRRVKPHRVWRHTSPLSSRAVKVLSGFLSS